MAYPIGSIGSSCLLAVKDKWGDMMTIKAFAEKYNVPNTLVTEAAVKVEHVATMERDVDYLEKDIYNAVLDLLEHKRDTAMAKATDCCNKINHMLFMGCKG